MKGKGTVLSLLFALSEAIAILVAGCSLADDQIGRVCVAPAPTAERDQRLDAGVEVYSYVYLDGDPDDCVSSTSLSEFPEVQSVGPDTWRVVGGFVHAPSDQPRTPDCGGGLVVATLGHLSAGSYVVESSLGPLTFDLPSPESQLCVSRP